MKTNLWTFNLAFYRASKAARAPQPVRPLAPAPSLGGAPRTWYGGTDPTADFRQARFTMLIYIAATLVIAALFSLLSAFTL